MVLVVAQKPFEHQSTGGSLSSFATLHPLLYEDGTPASREDFPSNGDVWWMLRPTTRRYCEPGRLVVAKIELSREAGSHDKAHFQAEVESVDAVRSRQFVEVIRIPSDRIGDIRRVITNDPIVTLDHRPLDDVYLRWGQDLYGPFRTHPEPHPMREGHYQVRFETAAADSTVTKVPYATVEALGEKEKFDGAVEVSLAEHAPYASSALHTVTVQLVKSDVLDCLIDEHGERLEIESDRQVLKRVARKMLTRKQRQQFLDTLEQLGELASDSRGELTGGHREILQTIERAEQEDQREIDQVAQGILDSGLLDQRVSDAIERRAERHIDEHAVALRARAEERVAEGLERIEELQKERARLEEQLSKERRVKVREAEEEAARIRAKVRTEIDEERRKLGEQQAELERQRQVLSGNIEKVLERLANKRDEVVNQFLAISPLLGALGFGARGGGAEPAFPIVTGDARSAVTAEPDGRQQKAAYEPPAFMMRASDASIADERKFFDRFVEHVEGRGFCYRHNDLASFHLAVKCNDLTVLGGLPGTGKSSLPRLYADALAGGRAPDDGVDEVNRYLFVGVSPSWLDMRDLIGHVNTLEGAFQPAETGLYTHMINAFEEYAQRGGDSGIYLVCLDEMNLAHIEHYFSGFLQALEQSDEKDRVIRCFAPEVVDRNSTFGRWPTIAISPAVRFVGTVNFDETTKPLSQRLLDRIDLVRLSSNDFAPGSSSPAGIEGPAVDVRSYRGWVNDSLRLSGGLAAMVDSLREPLETLGCPVSPRRWRGIRRFVASANGILNESGAFDLQIAQRILPQVRDLFRPGARDALDGIRLALETGPGEFPTSMQRLEELESAEARSLWIPEE